VLLLLAVAAGVAAALVLTLGGGGKSRAGSAASAGTASVRARASHKHTASHATARTAGAGKVAVAVLNGTETAGLAHRLSEQLRRGGYAQATPMGGRPPGANQATLVEYVGSHRGDAEGVARALGVAQPQPMEATVASLSGSATVVVIVGLDKASTVR
jgi:LytR cell envelope-related transcriptional attenuator